MVGIETTARFTDDLYFSGENPEMNNLMGELVLNGTPQKIKWIFADLNDTHHSEADDQMQMSTANGATVTAFNERVEAPTNGAPCISKILSNLLVAPVAQRQCETSTKSFKEPERLQKTVRASAPPGFKKKRNQPTPSSNQPAKHVIQYPVDSAAFCRSALEFFRCHINGGLDFDAYLQSHLLQWKTEKHFNSIQSQLEKGIAQEKLLSAGGYFSCDMPAFATIQMP